jgi:putative pyrroloquinoline-quinone binding quinoprotein
MRRRAAIPVLSALILLTGCTGDDPAPSSRTTPSSESSDAAEDGSSASDLPALEKAWTSDLGGDLGYVDPGAGRTGDLAVWTVGDALVLAGEDRVTAVSAATGEQVWTWSPARELGTLCAVGDPAETGVVGLVAGHGRRCQTVVALDLTRGRELWRGELGADYGDSMAGRAPYSAPDRLVVPTFCGATRVFSLKRGAPLPDLATPTSEGRCDVRTWIRDGIAVVFDHPGGEESSVLSAIDLDRDRTLWRTSTTRIGKLQGVRSTDPFVLDVIDRDVSLTRVFDDRGRPGRVVGLQTWGESTSTSSLGVLDDHLVLSYEGSALGIGGSHYYGFDLATGAADWETRVGRQALLGRHGDALLVLGGDARELGTAAVLGQAPGSDVTAATTLGTVPVPNGARLGWSDQLFLVNEGAALTAYRFPRASRQPMPPLSGVLSPGSPGDVAPDADQGICTAIDTETLVGLGVPDDGLPAPAQCIWYVGGTGGLRVHATVWADSDEAADAVEQVFEGIPGSFEPEDAVPLAGVGDKALVASTHFGRTVLLRLVVSRHNLVIGLDTDHRLLGHKTTAADETAVQAAAIEAMEQMFEAAPLAGDT